jgi:WD40 repeat protein
MCLIRPVQRVSSTVRECDRVVLGRCLRNLRGHTRAVQGLAIAPNGEIAVSCSADCTVKVWKIPHAPFEHGPVEQDAKPVSDLVGQKAFMGVDYQFEGDKFATCGAAVDIWDVQLGGRDSVLDTLQSGTTSCQNHPSHLFGDKDSAVWAYSTWQALHGAPAPSVRGTCTCALPSVSGRRHADQAKRRIICICHEVPREFVTVHAGGPRGVCNSRQ